MGVNTDFVHDFPADVTLHILQFLDLLSLSKFAQTCKRANELCQTSSLWAKLWRESWGDERTDLGPISLKINEHQYSAQSEQHTAPWKKGCEMYNDQEKQWRVSSKVSYFTLKDGSEENHANVVYFRICPVSNLLFTLSCYGCVRAWNLEKFLTNKDEFQFPLYTIEPTTTLTDPYRAVRLDTRFGMLSVGKFAGHVFVYKVDQQCAILNQKLECSISDPVQAEVYATYLLHNSRLFVGHGPSHVREWDLISGKNIRSFRFSPNDKEDDMYFCLTDDICGILPEERNTNGTIFTSHESGIIHSWERTTGKLLKSFQGHEEVCGRIALTQNNTRLVSTSFDATIRVWDVLTGDCLIVLDTYYPVGGMSLSVWGKRYLAVLNLSHDFNKFQGIQIWDIVKGVCLKNEKVDSVFFPDRTNSSCWFDGRRLLITRDSPVDSSHGSLVSYYAH
eukprot:c11129_g1_i3.p1 GENE.c11129_g1_i3~~c11129_g1_i3.p1  ORF type:complete len:448 (+),score=159.99 c11129_g1_i3:77-1420(+)